MKTNNRILLVSGLLMAASIQSFGLTIVRTNDASMSNVAIISAADAASASAAFDYAAAKIQALFNDPVQINITLAATTDPAVLGQSSSGLVGNYTYAQIRTALINDQAAAPSADGATATAALPVADPYGGTNFLMARGLAKGIGLIPSDATTDGTFTFGTSFTYSYDPLNRAQAGKVDFIGVAYHEITEIMGRVARLNSTGNGNRPFDVFRFTAAATQSVNFTDANVYFSVDANTNLKVFNANGNGGDLGDWASGSNDAFNAFSSSGVLNDLTPLDIRVMDVLGWNLAPPAAPVTSSLGSVVTGEFAPNGAGANDGTKFDALKRGGFLSHNGNLVFPGYLLVGTGGVTSSPNNFMGLWKQPNAGTVSLLARSGNVAPGTGSALFDVLPQVPGISHGGEVSFLGSLVIGTGAVPVTSSSDTGIWTEVGGGGLKLVAREGSAVPGLADVIKQFGSGCYATVTQSATQGMVAYSATTFGAPDKSGIYRTQIQNGVPVSSQVVVFEGSNVGTPFGDTFGNLMGSYSDPQRMDETGKMVFAAVFTPSGRESIWFEDNSTVSLPARIFMTGDSAPGTGGATFKNIKSPHIRNSGNIVFRGLLNNNGDNAAGTKNDGIWFGTAANSFGYTCILRRGDDNTNRAGLGLPAGAKVGNLWHAWLSNLGHVALRGWLNVNGNGALSSTANGDVYAIYSNLSGTMSLMVKGGDAAPGIAGATFTPQGFDLPVVGGVEQCAFIGTVTGGGTTAANNKGIWRCAANGGALSLLLRTGDTLNTSQGLKTISNVDFPGSGNTDRRWEQPVMDSTGRLLVYVTFVGGATTQVLVP
ncbi:MAG: NF038122 family metalloprotease [Verrucomicrobiaceae bacterium]|nr:NF038122 family metalloprotease [Verrucomicrobiaceae bacterium]